MNCCYRPIVNVVEDWFPYQKTKRAWGLVVRTILVLGTVIIALPAPFFRSVGAFSSVAILMGISTALVGTSSSVSDIIGQY